MITLPAIVVRVAPEHHRFAAFAGGKYKGLKGPGILVRLPAPGANEMAAESGKVPLDSDPHPL